ncbi:MAG: FAD-dependent oxidoreductase [Caulobacteraceae bacterium]|nr:MAG: FAD-dependent oxidoreductase [Caulobacteraceae bacterium]
MKLVNSDAVFRVLRETGEVRRPRQSRCCERSRSACKVLATGDAQINASAPAGKHMFQDMRGAPDGASHEADLCIIGGGTAGLALARLMIGKPFKVIVLESGGFKSEWPTQSLYQGESVGQQYEALEANRSRFLGGSSNCWGGWCRIFDEQDFEARDWVPNSGWPITKAQLDPYYVKARDVLEVGQAPFDEAYWREKLAPEGIDLMQLAGSDVQTVINQFSPPTRMGIRYRKEIEAATNVHVHLNANVVDIATGAEAKGVTELKVVTLGGKTATVRARAYVLACGGIENARLLLASNGTQPAGLGNDNDVVGRYFMDHPRISSLSFRMQDQKRYRRVYDHTLALTRRRLSVAHLKMAAHFAPTLEVQRQKGLLNSRTYVTAHYHGELTGGYARLRRMRQMLRDGRRFGLPLRRLAKYAIAGAPAAIAMAPDAVVGLYDNIINPERKDREFTFETVIEPVPNPQSRVTLGEAKDALGMNVARVDWRLTSQDRDNFIQSVSMVNGALRERGVVTSMNNGRSGDPAEMWEKDVQWCWHHMGTTRMHENPKQGVVDQHCKVHGVANLFIAGSSVFPTVSSDTPTLTLVALALRLGEHLTGVLGSVAL